MKIAVFTSNMPRHVSLINSLAKIADTVYAVQECVTHFPGAVDDPAYNISPLIKQYFDHVVAAERNVFGNVVFSDFIHGG